MSVFFEITAINHGNRKSGIDDFPSSPKSFCRGFLSFFTGENNPDQHPPDLSTEYGFKRLGKPNVPASAGGLPNDFKQSWRFGFLHSPKGAEVHVSHIYIYIMLYNLCETVKAPWSRSSHPFCASEASRVPCFSSGPSYGATATGATPWRRWRRAKVTWDTSGRSRWDWAMEGFLKGWPKKPKVPWPEIWVGSRFLKWL